MDRINDSSAWRAFDEAEITHSAAHYLLAIMHLREEFGYARVTDVADYLKVSRGAASRAIALVKERGWIEEDAHRMLLMTAAGLELTRSVERNFLVAERFFESVLGVPNEIAREDACKLEHLLSRETSEAMLRFLKAIHADPAALAALKERMKGVGVDECGVSPECPICGSSESCIAAGTDLDREHPHDESPATGAKES